jgi:hypothetical protein
MGAVKVRCATSAATPGGISVRPASRHVAGKGCRTAHPPSSRNGKAKGTLSVMLKI